MRRQIVARLVQSIVVILVVTTISFFVIRLAPGDPFSYDAPNIPPAVREHLRSQFGYDRPLGEQFVRYVSNVARGELGFSITRHQPVTSALAVALPRTFLLMGIALSLSVVLGVTIGVAQAARRDGWFDRITSAVLLVLYSLPDFWGAMMALLVFAYWIPILPPGGMVEPALHDYMSGTTAFLDRLQHLILPAGALAVLTVAGIARYQRSAMLEVIPADYIRTARAKGVSERQIVWRHALRTALTPIVTLLGLILPALLGGALFIERVFAWDGMGSLIADAISSRDYDVVTAGVIVGSILVVLGNLLADVLHMIVDPRVRE